MTTTDPHAAARRVLAYLHERATYPPNARTIDPEWPDRLHSIRGDEDRIHSLFASDLDALARAALDDRNTP